MHIKRLKDLREDSDLTQSEVSKIINCTQATYSKYELGKREIPVGSLLKLAKFYNTSVDYILGVTNIKDPIDKIF